MTISNEIMLHYIMLCIIMYTFTLFYGVLLCCESSEAEWRYAWLVRSFFNWRTLRSLQAEVLSAYDADDFQARIPRL